MKTEDVGRADIDGKVPVLVQLGLAPPEHGLGPCLALSN